MLVGLAVDGDQQVGDRLERRHRHRGAAEERARPTLGGQPGGRAPACRPRPRPRTRRPGRRPRRRPRRCPRRGRPFAPLRTAPASARAPSRRPSAVTSIVLPAPVSPVTTFSPGPSSSTDSSITPRELIRISSITASRPCARGRARTFRRRSLEPRQPSTGSPNFATSRSVNGASCSRTRWTGCRPRRTSIRAPGGRSTVRRPSHHSTPAPSVWASTSTASTESGATTIGRANSAWALIGTISSASTRGHTIGPPAEKLYAVEPVGRRADDAVAAPPAQRAAVDLDDDLEHPLPRGLLDAGLVERPRRRDQLLAPVDRHVDGEPVLAGVAPGDDRLDGGLDVLALRLGQEAHVAEVHPEQRRATCRGSARRRAGWCRRRRAPRPARSRSAASASRRPARCPAPARAARSAASSARTRTSSRARAAPRSPAARPRWHPRARCARAAGSGAVGVRRLPRRVRLELTRHSLSSATPLARTLGTGSPRPRMSARATAASPRRSQRKNSTLPDGPGSGLVATPTRAPAAFRGRGGDAEHRLGALRGVAHDAALAQPVLADLELRFDHQHQVAVRHGSRAISASSTSRSEMNERSPTTRSTGPPTSSGVRSRTLVRSCTCDPRGRIAATRRAGRSRRRPPPPLPHPHAAARR